LEFWILEIGIANGSIAESMPQFAGIFSTPELAKAKAQKTKDSAEEYDDDSPLEWDSPFWLADGRGFLSEFGGDEYVFKVYPAIVDADE